MLRRNLFLPVRQGLLTRRVGPQRASVRSFQTMSSFVGIKNIRKPTPDQVAYIFSGLVALQIFASSLSLHFAVGDLTVAVENLGIAVDKLGTKMDKLGTKMDELTSCFADLKKGVAEIQEASKL